MNNTYKLSAYMLCHDVRVSTYISTTVETEARPTEQEAAVLLSPVAEEVLRRNLGEGCQYELSGISIQ
ncbi:hypothetical protein GO755_29350 [Spirosoma sp. HMF4905]|uniref:Uncharacterized protein n=1 Tax=Spirosoma arboris TaxID=2682092 RepID=A0A7K1SK74_9BACT|nr:hypothetical protein [Spirosoma arboris]MVM34175.1 hypothetical protein [Spirosoma arboris]